MSYKITPVTLTTHLLRRPQIRSSIPGRGLSSPKPRIGALPRDLSPVRSAYEQFRVEPAISSLDWTFTPIPKSHQRFAHQYDYGPPPQFPVASSCSGIVRLASGIQRLTDGEHTIPLAKLRVIGFPTATILHLNLASPRNSMDQFSNRTHGHCITLSCPYSLFADGFTSLHLPLGVLFSFHSRYYFSIGLGECLGLGVCASHIRARFPTHRTLR